MFFVNEYGCSCLYEGAVLTASRFRKATKAVRDNSLMYVPHIYWLKVIYLV